MGYGGIALEEIGWDVESVIELIRGNEVIEPISFESSSRNI
jgi:hypothetical protein